MCMATSHSFQNMHYVYLHFFYWGLTIPLCAFAVRSERRNRGESDLAILATKEANLDLKLFAVDASFDPQEQYNKIAKIEEKYVTQFRH